MSEGVPSGWARATGAPPRRLPLPRSTLLVGSHSGWRGHPGQPNETRNPAHAWRRASEPAPELLPGPARHPEGSAGLEVQTPQRRPLLLPHDPGGPLKSARQACHPEPSCLITTRSIHRRPVCPDRPGPPPSRKQSERVTLPARRAGLRQPSCRRAPADWLLTPRPEDGRIVGSSNQGGG